MLITMSLKSALNVSSRMLMVPIVAMWLDFVSRLPSGTNGTMGAQSASPSLRAIASQFALST